MKWNIFVGSLVLSLGLSTQSFGANLLDRMLGVNYNGDCDTATRCETSCSDPCPSLGCDTASVPCATTCRKTPLLDMMRGLRQRMACDTCCEPVCGCEDPCAEPACGFEAPCAEPVCGCEDPCAAVACDCCCVKCRKRPLLDMLRRLRNKVTCDTCCEPVCGCEDPCAEPVCGCEDPCAEMVGDPCCPPKRPGLALVRRIFGGRKSSCCEPVCGYEEPVCGYEPGCGFEMAPPAGGAPTEAEQGDNGEAEGDEVGPAPVVDPTAFLPTKRRFIQTNLVR